MAVLVEVVEVVVADPEVAVVVVALVDAGQKTNRELKPAVDDFSEALVVNLSACLFSLSLSPSLLPPAVSRTPRLDCPPLSPRCSPRDSRLPPASPGLLFSLPRTDLCVDQYTVGPGRTILPARTLLPAKTNPNL